MARSGSNWAKKRWFAESLQRSSVSLSSMDTYGEINMDGWMELMKIAPVHV